MEVLDGDLELLTTSSESVSKSSSCSHLIKVSLEPPVSFSGVRFFLRMLNFLAEFGVSLNGFSPLRIEVRSGVMRSWRLVRGVGIVVLHVLKLSSLGIRSTLAGVFVGVMIKRVPISCGDD